MNNIYENLEEKVDLFEDSNSSNHQKYIQRLRKIDRTKESFDDIFISTLNQSFLRSNHILTPLEFQLKSENKNNEIAFNFIYKGNYLSLTNFLEEKTEIFNDHRIIKFLCQASRTFEYLKQNKFYFQNFSSHNVLVDELAGKFIFIGYEHETKFYEELMFSNVHKENMLSLALLAFRMATGESHANENSFNKLSALMKGILKPLLEGKEDERPSSFEYFLFLKKGKRKRWREIFFVNQPNSEIEDYQTNSCVGIENKKTVYILDFNNELNRFDNLNARYGCYNRNNLDLILFGDRKGKIMKSTNLTVSKEFSYPDSNINRWNAISNGKKLILVGGEYENFDGKSFSPNVYELDEKLNWKNLEPFPITTIDGKFQMFIDKSILNVIGYSHMKSSVICAKLDLSNKINQKWDYSLSKWKSKSPTEQLLSFIGPYNSLLIVGLFNTHGILYSRNSKKSIRIEVYWKKDSFNFSENKKFGIGNGIVWDGNYSKILIGTSNGVFIFTCKIDFSKSMAAISLKPIAD